MKMITEREPHASLTAAGIKTSETRWWAPPKGLVGEHIGIHAAARRITLAEVANWNKALRRAASDLFPALRAFNEFRSVHTDIPYGAVLATVRLVHFGQVVTPPDYRHGGVFICRTPHGAMFDGRDDGLGDYRLGRWVWLFDDIDALPEPIPAVGRQGLWNWDPPSGWPLPAREAS